jgi:carboxylesterase type B
MASPVSAGLFQRVIQQSNPAGFMYLTPQHAAVYGDALVSKAGCGRPGKGVSHLDCLRDVPAGLVMVRLPPWGQVMSGRLG